MGLFCTEKFFAHGNARVCMCSEAHESAVNALASTRLAPALARLAATSTTSAGVCRRAAELVHVCSDNSPAICDQLCQSDGLVDLLVSVCSGSASTPAASDAPCRVHLCGTLVHLAMYASNIPAPAAIALVQQLMEILTSFIIPQMEVQCPCWLAYHHRASKIHGFRIAYVWQVWQEASLEMQRLLQQKNEQSAAAAAASSATTDGDVSDDEGDAQEDAKMEQENVEIHNVTADIDDLQDGPWVTVVKPHLTACEVLANVVCGLRDGKDVMHHEAVDWASDDEDAMEKVAHAMGGAGPAVSDPQAVSSEWDVVVTQLVDMGLLQNVSAALCSFVATCALNRRRLIVLILDVTSVWACCKHTSKRFLHKSWPAFRLRTVSSRTTLVAPPAPLAVLILLLLLRSARFCQRRGPGNDAGQQPHLAAP